MTNPNTALAAPVGLQYNLGMKTAISLPDAIYRAGELLAKRLKLPRSRLYALALADYIERHADDDITQRLNASLAATARSGGRSSAPRAARRPRCGVPRCGVPRCGVPRSSSSPTRSIAAKSVPWS
jgi:hypothetical protein